MPRLYLRLILAAIVVALLTISTGAALAAPPQQDPVVTGPDLTLYRAPGPTARLGMIELDEGETGTFTLKLNESPNGILTVGLQNQGLYDVTVSPASLTFYNNTWGTAQTVTVTAIDDGRVEGREDHQIRLNLSGTGSIFDTGYFGSMVIRIIDNDFFGLHLGDDTVQITEDAVHMNGDPVELTKFISLASAPDTNETVTVTYTLSPDAPFTITPATSMTFTSSDWQTAQPLVITPTTD